MELHVTGESMTLAEREADSAAHHARLMAAMSPEERADKVREEVAKIEKDKKAERLGKEQAEEAIARVKAEYGTE